MCGDNWKDQRMAPLHFTSFFAVGQLGCTKGELYYSLKAILCDFVTLVVAV